MATDNPFAPPLADPNLPSNKIGSMTGARPFHVELHSLICAQRLFGFVMHCRWNSWRKPNETTVKGQALPRRLRTGRRTVSAAIAKLLPFAADWMISAWSGWVARQAGWGRKRQKYSYVGALCSSFLLFKN